MQANEYDALLAASPQAETAPSEYDALLTAAPEPAKSSPYDALLTAAPQQSPRVATNAETEAALDAVRATNIALKYSPAGFLAQAYEGIEQQKQDAVRAANTTHQLLDFSPAGVMMHVADGDYKVEKTPYNPVRELMLSPGDKPPQYTHQELSNALTPSKDVQTTPNAGVSALTGQPAAAGGFVEPSRTGTPGTDVQGIDTPIVNVSPAVADAYLGSNLVTAPSYRFLKAMSPERASGVAEGAAGFASGLTTGQNVAMMVGLAGSPAIVEKLVAAGFSLQAAHGAYEQSKELANETDPKKQASLATGILLNGAMATFGAIGAAKGLKAEQPAEISATDTAAKTQIDSALAEVIHSPESVTMPPVEETPQMPVESPKDVPAVSEQPAPETQPQTATEAAQPTETTLPKGTVVRSSNYAHEGDIEIVGEPQRVNGRTMYDAYFNGTRRMGTISAEHIDKIVSTTAPAENTAPAPNLASAREAAFNQAHPETDITPDPAHLAAAIADVQENHGTQFYKDGEPTAYVVRSMEEGRPSWKLVEPTAEAVRGRDGELHAPEIGFDTSEEAVASGLKRGFEVDPNVLSDYEKTRGQTASGLPEQPPREGETQPSQEQGASVQAAQTGGAGQTRVRIAIPDSPTGVPDLIDFVKEQGGIKLPPKERRGQEYDDVNDASHPVRTYYAGKLLGARGAIMADEMAQMARDAGLTKDAHPSTFWEALRANIEQRPRTREMAREMQRKMAEAEKRAQKEEAAATKQNLPTLRQGENQGDLLSKQTEDLSLVGEKGTDFAKREAEKQAAEKAAQEAKDLQETQQGKLPIDEATQKAIETHASEQGYLAEPPSPVPQGERPSSELPGNEEVLSTEQSRAREKAHLDAYNLANRLAEQVARGQPDSVREAAAMAAYDNARRSIESGGRFNPEFMRKSAMRAAGDAAKKQGASLDAPLSEDGETTGKDQLADEGRTPDDAAADHEAIAKADALLKGLNPREQAIVRAVTMEGRTLREVGDELGISHERVRQIHEQALEKLRKRMAQADAISAGTKDQVFDENAMRPAAKVIAQSIDPREAAQVTPQALGIRAPLPQFLRDAIDYFTTNSPSQIWNSVKGSLDATLGKTFAKTTIADRKAGELAARWISARIAAPHLAQTFAANVLEGTGIDPVKFGAALTEDNLRSIKKSALDEGRTAEAANVVSIIGAKDSPFKTEGEYQSFLASPDTQTAIQRHQSLWDSSINPMFRKAQLLDPAEPLPTRGEQTQARVNLYNDVEAKGKDVVSGTGTGNLTATTRKKSPFAIQAKGTGQSYNVNYADMMANTFGRQLEIASKNAFEQQLVDSGNAIIGKPAKDVTLPDGEATVAFPLKRTVLIDAADGGKIPVNQNIFVRKSLAGEYRRGADVDLIKVPGALRAFNNVVNRTALAGLTDASVHVLNLGTALLTRPSVAGGVLRDSLLSAFGRADVPVIAIKALVKGFQDNRAQLSELAEIGAMRQQHPTINPMGKVIEWADKTTRLVLDDAFKNMTDAGLVDGTETNRREFVNQIGQYNKRAQGDLRRLARDSGFGPFATAGTTFNTLGLRTLTLSPGATATSAMAAASLRANVMAKWVGAFALTGSLNYLLTGNVAGRPGVPIGKIDTGLNDENKRPLSLPLFDLLGLGRALRVTGVRGFVESKRKGLSTQNALDSAATDIWNTNISPFTGPAIRFAGVASSGKQIPSVNVPRTSRVVPPGESQWQENLKQAIIDANPIIKSVALAHEPGQGVGAAIRQQIPRISLQPSQSAEFMSKYPEIVRKAQSREYVNDVIGRARKMAPTEQRSFVRESLGKLTPEDRKQAERTLKYSRILY